MRIFGRGKLDEDARIDESANFTNEYVETGCRQLDKLLGGGFPVGFVTHVYGPPGVGKTNLCLSACARLAKKGRALFVDTEGGFSAERLRQIGADKKRIFVRQVNDFDEQGRVVRGLCKSLDENFRLVVIDSAVSLYRLRIEGERKKVLEISRELGRELAHLSKVARDYKVAVVVTNQVYNSFDGKEEIVPVGGGTLMYWAKIILELQRENENGRRKAIIRKHPHKAEGFSEKFEIVRSGLR